MPSGPEICLNEADIQAERVRAVFRLLPAVLFINVVNATLMTVALVTVEHWRAVYAWLAAMLCLCTIRLALWYRHQRSPEPVRRWAVASAGGAFASGLLWGAGAALLLPHAQIYQLLWVFLIGGMCAGAAVFHAEHLPTALAYIFPACLPLLIRFADGRFDQRIAAAMIAVYLVALTAASRDASRRFGVFLRLQLDLAQRTRELDALNAKLRTEMAEHRATEAMLRQTQKMEAVGQLTGGIAHDFNNMLQAIGGSVEMLQHRIEQGRAGEAYRYIDSARKGVARAASLTQRLLAFARRQQLQPQPVDPDVLIRGMEDLIRHTVGPAVSVEMQPGAAARLVFCDPHQLESALLNVTINARDAMPDGGRLIIRTTETHLGETDAAQEGATPGQYVEIAISDTGFGMDETTRLRAFEPFFTTKPIGEGTGLGLSQLHGFVSQSGGIVRLESAPDRGTTVRLYLPLHQAKAEWMQNPAMQEPAISSGDVVLLVEDEPGVRTLAAERLRELGYHVMEAGDGPTALHLLRFAPRVDMLVTDVGLPGGLNGRQVADAARERRPGLPVLFITGYAGGALAAYLAPGMGVIGKPFSLEEFASRVSAMMQTAVE